MSRESFGFVAFRSRQQTAAFESALKKRTVDCRLINTPHEIGMGCGLSVKFALTEVGTVLTLCDTLRPTALIGVYEANWAGSRLVCKPISRTARHW